MSRLLFLGNPEDAAYLGHLKSCAGTASLAGSCNPVSTLYEVTSVVKKRGFDGVLTTSLPLLQKLVGAAKLSQSEESINNYAGSYFEYQNIPFVILRPLHQLVTVPYGKFLARRYITKLSQPESWMQVSKFNWRILTGENIQEWYAKLSSAKLISCDIETIRVPLAITCIGYTGVFEDGTSASVVLPIDSMWAVTWMRKFNSLPAPKIFQNGKYDNAYLTAWNAPIYNWLWDTANLFHSWYSELPKDLGFLNAFCVREAAYWKDLANTNDLNEYYRYNALDTWATANAMLALINEMPQWALNNYVNEFPLNFPCHLSEMTGIPRDFDKLKEGLASQEAIIAKNSASLDTMLGVKNFNVASSNQKKAALNILGCADIAKKSTDEKSLKKAAYRHPLNARICNAIIATQKARKLKSTYLTPGKEYNGVLLYSLNPHGTDTSRLASREHHFWCGVNIQNTPRGRSLPKQSLVPYPGFLLAEVDLEQAESRDTAFIAGEEKLIAAVTGERDFHSVNSSAFFGIPYEDIFDAVLHKVKNTDIRDLGKKVNHGANYVMGPDVMVDTMGDEHVFKASILLKLPRFWKPRDITAYLLSRFHATYPGLEGVYYPAVIHEIVTTKLLTSSALHDCLYQAAPEGLVRYCFGDPVKNKRNKNAYVAHPPQSLNARTLNKAYMTVFYEIAMHHEHKHNFKLCAQIHDSILFMFREGHTYLCKMVQDRMEIPVTVRGYDGKTRTFTVPAAIKAGKDGQGARSWAEI